VVGHVINDEKYIRVIEAGIKTKLRLLIFYPYTLLGHQIGPYVSGIILVWLSFCLFQYRMISKKTISSRQSNLRLDGFVFLILCIVIPLAILSLDTSKSGVVGAIAIMPALWLVIWLTLLLDNECPTTKNAFWIFNSIAVITLMIAVANQLKAFPDYERSSNQKDLTAINKMHHDIAAFAAKNQWKMITLSSDRVLDFLQPTHIPLTYYESDGKLLESRSTALGTGIFAASEDEMLKAMTNSNVVIFNLSNNYPAQSPYPADTRIAAFKTTLIRVAERDFTLLGDYEIRGFHYRAYVRPKKLALPI
jgi:hypothetical protein